MLNSMVQALLAQLSAGSSPARSNSPPLLHSDAAGSAPASRPGALSPTIPGGMAALPLSRTSSGGSLQDDERDEMESFLAETKRRIARGAAANGAAANGKMTSTPSTPPPAIRASSPRPKRVPPPPPVVASDHASNRGGGGGVRLRAKAKAKAAASSTSATNGNVLRVPPPADSDGEDVELEGMGQACAVRPHAVRPES